MLGVVATGRLLGLALQHEEVGFALLLLPLGAAESLLSLDGARLEPLVQLEHAVADVGLRRRRAAVQLGAEAEVLPLVHG